MCKFFGTTGMTAVASQFHRTTSVTAVLATVFAVFRSSAVARRMSALLIVSHMN
jgi:hypothetical protein